MAHLKSIPHFMQRAIWDWKVILLRECNFVIHHVTPYWKREHGILKIIPW